MALALDLCDISRIETIILISIIAILKRIYNAHYPIPIARSMFNELLQFYN